MFHFRNDQHIEQYYTNNCQQLIPLTMNVSEITEYVTNRKLTPSNKGEYLEWKMFDWLNANGFTPSKTTCRNYQTNAIKGDGGVDLFATRLVNNQRMNFVIQSKCYVSRNSIINEEVIGKLIQRAEQYNAIGILFCYNLQNITNGTRTTDNGVRLITEHPKLLMYDINTIGNLIPDLMNLTPTINQQIEQRPKYWFKIDKLINEEQTDNVNITNMIHIDGITIKATRIEGLEFKTY